MSKENNIQIAKNTIFLYVRMFVLMLVSLYTTRLLLKVLGIDDYGIFNVVGGLIVMITFVNQGLTAASRRYIMEEMTNGTLKSQQLIYTNVILSHIILCSVFLIIGETIGLWFFCSKLNIPVGRFEAAMWVYQLSLFSSIFTVMLSPSNAVIVSEEKMSAYAYFSIIDAILKLLIVWALMAFNGDKLIIYAFLLLGVNFIDYLLYYSYCRLSFPMCRIVKLNGNKQLKDLFGYMGWTVYGLGANTISRQGVSMLINIYFNVAVNAAIGVSNMIIGAASQFVNNFQMAFAPQIIKKYLSNNYSELNGLISRASRYSSFLVLIILIPSCIVISDLLEIWLGDYPTYTEEFCILTLVCIYIDALSNPLITVITANKNIKIYQIFISCVYLADFIICWFVLFLGALPYFVIIIRAMLCIVGLIIRLIITKKRVTGFSAFVWSKSILGRGSIIVFLSLPLLLVKSLVAGNLNLSLWSRFITIGTISFLWVISLIWVFGLSLNERVFIRNKIKNIL